ncbi:GD13710 [Drosophila simulans]|uniref:GD13710 n=1 Tax=Drosophila simulans TaxID=7240 RepID=B4QNM1_DROSI|nr:GD13710 [Drosophila simulans]
MSSALTRLLERLPLKKQTAQSGIRVFSNQEQQQQEVEDDEEFRVLSLRTVKQQFQKRQQVRRDPITPPRTGRMAVDQDWTAVWEDHVRSTLPMGLCHGGKDSRNAEHFPRRSSPMHI